MTAILRKLPFVGRASTVRVHGAVVAVKAHQIVTWVSVSSLDHEIWEGACPRFPAIIDTGNNFTFSIREALLQKWAGLDPRSLDLVRPVRHRGRYLPGLAAYVWLHRNQPGQRDAPLTAPPIRLELEPGIAVYPNDAAEAPRLPLIGLQALTRNRLHLLVDAQQGWVSLRSHDWKTRLLQWLAW